MAEKNQPSILLDIVRSATDKAIPFLAQGISLLRFNSEKTREQVKEMFHSTSDQVLEKAEATRQAVKLRMAILEIEHHLSRLYPQIGKLLCDLAEDGKKSFHQNPDVKTKLELAAEYRERLAELKAHQKEHHRTKQEEDPKE